MILNAISRVLDTHGYTLSTLLLELLSMEAAEHKLVRDLLDNVQTILDAIIQHPGPAASSATHEWLSGAAQMLYLREVHELTDKDTGWHFSAGTVEPWQLEDLDLGDMADRMRSTAPCLWRFLDSVISHRKGKDCANDLAQMDDQEPDARAKPDDADLMDDVQVEPAVEKARRHVQQHLARREVVANTVSPIPFV